MARNAAIAALALWVPAAHADFDPDAYPPHETCAVCHGQNAIGGVADLRHMDADTHGKFNAIVLEGLYLAKGMAAFDDLLDEDEVAAIHAYVIARANEDWGR